MSNENHRSTHSDRDMDAIVARVQDRRDREERRAATAKDNRDREAERLADLRTRHEAGERLSMGDLIDLDKAERRRVNAEYAERAAEQARRASQMDTGAGIDNTPEARYSRDLAAWIGQGQHASEADRPKLEDYS